MDKTYSDLMDIVNRTKKFDGGSRPAPVRPRPRPQVVEEVEEDEYVPREYDIEENEGRGKKGSNLFGGAIGKLISEDKPKKSSTKKAPAKKETAKKTETKKSTATKAKTAKPKVQVKKEEPKVEVKPKKVTPKDSILNSMDTTDPKNAQLYEALKSSLYEGGTDISDYIPEEESSETMSSLQELRAKREANKINAEITKEQQEYELLFNGSLGLLSGEEEIAESESHTNTQSKVELDASSDATYELETGNKDLDRKIAEYYKRKQEKINEYKKLEEDGFVDMQKTRDVYEDRKKAYQDMFGGPLMTKEEPAPVVENTLPAGIETVAHASQIAKVETDNQNWQEEKVEITETQSVEDRDDHIRSLLSGLLSSRAEKEFKPQTPATETATESVENIPADVVVETPVENTTEVVTAETPLVESASQVDETTSTIEESLVTVPVVEEVENTAVENTEESVTTTEIVAPVVVETNEVESEVAPVVSDENSVETEDTTENVEVVESPVATAEENTENAIHEVSEEKREELINSVIMGELNSNENRQTIAVDNVEETPVAEETTVVESTENVVTETPTEAVEVVENAVPTESVTTESYTGSQSVESTEVANTESVAEESKPVSSVGSLSAMIASYNNLKNPQTASVEEVVEEVAEETQAESATEEVVASEEVVESDVVETIETPEVVMEENTQANVEEVERITENNGEFTFPQTESVVEDVASEESNQIIDEEIDYSDLDDEELDRIDRSEDEEDFTDYIVSTNEPVERSEKITKSLSEYEDIVRNERLFEKNFAVEKEEESPIVNYKDSKTYVVGDITDANNYVDYFDDGETVEVYQEETKEEKDDSISKEEFYNEMARLQENLINELKGNKEEIKDYFAEKEMVSETPVEGTIENTEETEKAEKIVGEVVADYLANLDEEKEEEVTTEETVATPVDNAPVAPVVETAVVETPVVDKTPVVGENVDYIPAEVSEPVTVGEDRFDEFNLLNKDVALNEDDLNYEQEREESENKEFYLSQEDNEKKALVDDYIDMFSNVKEMGDININKNIGNAIPSSEVLKQQEELNVTAEKPASENEENAEEMVEEIFTLMGIQKKPIKEENNELKVLYVASECQPFIATGGLADVAGSLPKAIVEEGGVDIRVIMPLYGVIKERFADSLEYLGNFTVHLSWRQEYCGLFRCRRDGVTYYFVDNERYFKRDKTYGYYDDGERFAYFSKAVVEGLPMLNFFPDIIHCNDWQSALVSTYIKTGNWSDFRYYKIKHIYTIHNVEYQGVYGMENLKDLFGIDSRFRNEVEYNGDINLTKAAIQFSDKFTTVSNSYCDNLKQPYCSRGLHHIIIRNEYKLSGIVNGIDYNFYSPSIDKCLYKNYDLGSMDEKVLNKKIWQEELGLPVDGDTPMISIVSRLVGHKGMDLVNKVMENTLQQDIQLVVVGTGDQKFVDYFKYLESKYPTKVRALCDAYSNELARKAYAASDIFLMPSKVEPCGISQMIASRYGAVPIVREVGGLKDTIRDFGCEGGGNGYTFTNYNPNDLQYTLDRAIRDYQNKPEWKEKMRICMTTDFTWKEPAKKYIDLYNSLKY